MSSSAASSSPRRRRRRRRSCYHLRPRHRRTDRARTAPSATRSGACQKVDGRKWRASAILIEQNFGCTAGTAHLRDIPKKIDQRAPPTGLANGNSSSSSGSGSIRPPARVPVLRKPEARLLTEMSMSSSKACSTTMRVCTKNMSCAVFGGARGRQRQGTTAASPRLCH